MNTRLTLVIAGVLLVVAAAFVSNNGLERVLLSDVSWMLGWGATLFRALLAAHGVALLIAGIVWMRRSRAKNLATPDHRMKTSRMSWIILVGLCLLALVLRLLRLDT